MKIYKSYNLNMHAPIVVRGINLDWIKSKAINKESLDLLSKVEEVLAKQEKGGLSDSHEIFTIELKESTLSLRECESVRSLKVYTEIFKENLHTLIEGFSGANVSTIVDLGANAGYYTMKVKLNNPNVRVVAVEPNPEVFELLTQNIKQNNIINVELVNKAVGKKGQGEIDFKTVDQASVLGGKYLGTLNKSKFPWLKESMIKNFKVSCISLEELLVEKNIEKIDILKLDVQDMEFEILEDSISILNRVDRIVVEPHQESGKQVVIKLLNEQGFELVYQESRDFGDLYFVRKELL